LKQAWEKSDGNSKPADAAKVYQLIQQWNRRSDADSTGALAYYAFKISLPDRLRRAAVDIPSNITDENLVEATAKAAEWLKTNFGALEVPYGRYFRVGREEGKTYPVSGGSLQDAGMATPRAISFGPRKTEAGNEMVGRGGQTSTQVVILSKTPQSFTILPLGQSDHKESGHWDDQAEKLFSKSRMKSTYFMNKAELLKHVTKKKTVNPAVAAGGK
jgi:acyl-homoserine lactone acylase PvdQ